MIEVVLHVHPTQDSARVGYRNHEGDAGVNVNVAPGASCRGLRAGMVYIYGDRWEWEDNGLQDWLQKNVLTRLVDDNPARVVWGASHA